MAKEPDKGLWEENQKNKSLSGIEIRDKNGKLCGFITIRHDEILESGNPHRISIRLNENAEPMLPPAQTFEEIIQAKRRHQMLLYGSNNSTSSAVLADRSRRVAAARQVAAAANLSRRTIASIPRRRPPPSKSKRSKKKPKPPATVMPPETQASPIQPSQPMEHTANDDLELPEKDEADIEPMAGPSTGQVVTSLKDLKKDNPLLKSIDPKEVKLLLKSAPPGASILLSNGTVIKKSRRGGARVGAGRKRSRPLPNNPLSPGQRDSNGNQLSSATSSFSSQA